MRLLRDLQRKKKIEAKKKLAKGVAFGTLVGGIVGSAAGILLAPDSGKNTRKKIQDSAINVKDHIHKNVEKAKDNMDLAKNSVYHKKTEICEAVEKIRNIGKPKQEDTPSCNETFNQKTSDEDSK